MKDDDDVFYLKLAAPRAPAKPSTRHIHAGRDKAPTQQEVCALLPWATKRKLTWLELNGFLAPTLVVPLLALLLRLAV